MLQRLDPKHSVLPAKRWSQRRKSAADTSSERQAAVQKLEKMEEVCAAFGAFQLASER